MDAQTELFAPPSQNWTPLSPRYAPLRRLSSAIDWLIILALVVVPLLIFTEPRYAVIGAAVVVLLAGWRFWRQLALARAWGYAERESDLYIKSGIFNRKLTVVPYGRMQAVEVTAGPLQRAFKVATVKLVTASAQSDAVIPGLEPDEAAALRDRLTLRGETQAAGL